MYVYKIDLSKKKCHFLSQIMLDIEYIFRINLNSTKILLK